MSHPTTICLNTEDDVEIALADLKPGDVTASGVALLEAVPRGHKLARRAIPTGGLVRRYGQIIGAATVDIPAGAHVHVQNIAMSDHPEDYAYASAAVRWRAPMRSGAFRGSAAPMVSPERAIISVC